MGIYIYLDFLFSQGSFSERLSDDDVKLLLDVKSKSQFCDLILNMSCSKLIYLVVHLEVD